MAHPLCGDPILPATAIDPARATRGAGAATARSSRAAHRTHMGGGTARICCFAMQVPFRPGWMKAQRAASICWFAILFRPGWMEGP